MPDQSAVSVAASGATDVIQYAAQMGRLDLVSALLAIVAILLALSAIPAYILIKRKAERIARNVVESIRAEVTASAEKIVIAKLEQDLPGLVEDYMALARNTVNDDVAALIAQAQEDHNQ